MTSFAKRTISVGLWKSPSSICSWTLVHFCLLYKRLLQDQLRELVNALLFNKLMPYQEQWLVKSNPEQRMQLGPNQHDTTNFSSCQITSHDT